MIKSQCPTKCHLPILCITTDYVTWSLFSVQRLYEKWKLGNTMAWQPDLWLLCCNSRLAHGMALQRVFPGACLYLFWDWSYHFSLGKTKNVFHLCSTESEENNVVDTEVLTMCKHVVYSYSIVPEKLQVDMGWTHPYKQDMAPLAVKASNWPSKAAV